MAWDINTFFGIGRIAHDIQIKQTSNGKAVLNFRLAMNMRPDSGNSSRSIFLDCTAWNNVANNISQFCHKGSLIVIEGFLDQQSWADDNGKKHVKTFCVINRFQTTGNSKYVENKVENKVDKKEEDFYDNTDFFNSEPVNVPF